MVHGGLAQHGPGQGDGTPRLSGEPDGHGLAQPGHDGHVRDDGEGLRQLEGLLDDVGRGVAGEVRNRHLVANVGHGKQVGGEEMRLAATLVEPATGRTLEVHTDQPGLQVYTGNYLDGSIVGPSGRRYRQGDGVALETQRLPDAPNRDWLPSPVLEPGQTYTSRTEWRLRT